jgi:hypothetical protein
MAAQCLGGECPWARVAGVSCMQPTTPHNEISPGITHTAGCCQDIKEQRALHGYTMHGDGQAPGEEQTLAA